MNENFKSGLKLFGRLIIINIMSLFLVISFTVIFTGLFTDNIGYVATGITEKDDKAVELYTHFYADGDDNLQKEYESKGYTISKTELRSELTKKQNAIYLTVTQVFCLLLMISFIHPTFWQMGAKDSNLVRFKHKKEDLYKGLKSGFIAIIPSVLLLLFLLITKASVSANFPVVLYRFINSSTYSFIHILTNGKVLFGDVPTLNVLLMFLPLLFPVVIATFSYILGYKNISLHEKLMYNVKG